MPPTTSQLRSQDMLRTFAHELPAADSEGLHNEPLFLARLMAKHNNAHRDGALDYTTECIQAPDLTWWDIAIVYDTRDMTGEGGDVVMCWWQRVRCPSCDGYGYTEVFHPSTDALIGTRDCTQKHPARPPEPPAPAVKHLPGCNGVDTFLDACCPPF